MLNIKTKLVTLMGPCGGYNFCRALTRSTPKILMYHRFSESPQSGFVHHEAFEKQMVYLKDNFNLISLNDLIKQFRQHGEFPINSVVITIDDGYLDFYDVAFPILKKHSIPATFFITTRFIDGDFWLWPDSVQYILQHSNTVDLNKITGGLTSKIDQMTNDDRRVLWGILVSYLLSITEDKKKIWLDGFAELQGINLPGIPVDNYRAVNWEQVRDLNANKIEIGVHTQTHPLLGSLNDKQLFVEVQGAVDIIHKQIGHKPTNFCFPYGRSSDYNELVKDHVKATGCESAVTAFYDEKLVNDLFELRRFGVGSDWEDFLRFVNGVDVLAARYFKANNREMTSF